MWVSSKTFLRRSLLKSRSLSTPTSRWLRSTSLPSESQDNTSNILRSSVTRRCLSSEMRLSRRWRRRVSISPRRGRWFRCPTLACLLSNSLKCSKAVEEVHSHSLLKLTIQQVELQQEPLEVLEALTLVSSCIPRAWCVITQPSVSCLRLQRTQSSKTTEACPPW